MSRRPLSFCCDVTSKEIFAIFANSVHSSDIHSLTQNHFKNALKLLSHTKILADFCTVFCPRQEMMVYGRTWGKKPPQGASGGTKTWGNHGVKLPTPFIIQGLQKIPSLPGLVRFCQGRLYFLAALYFAITGLGLGGLWRVRAGAGDSRWNGELKEAEKCYIGQLGAATRRGAASGYY